jgi:hypothetical protein
VRRSAGGDFSAGTITANLTGNASGSAGSCTGNSATVTGFSPTTGKTLSVQKTITLTSPDDTSVATLPAGSKTLLATDGSAASLTSFPTLNQDTTGLADRATYLKSLATTGKISLTGPTTGATRAKTVRDADDTIMELGGSYTPSGTWVWTSATATWPTFNQDTTGTAAKSNDVVWPISTKTNTYPITAADSIIICDTTSNAFTVTLPTAVNAAGKMYRIKRVSAGTNRLTIATTSSQTIDGQTSVLVDERYAALTIVSDGSNWHIL